MTGLRTFNQSLSVFGDTSSSLAIERLLIFLAK
jgi:hypothetical protein